jgi:hypothetical protein
VCGFQVTRIFVVALFCGTRAPACPTQRGRTFNSMGKLASLSCRIECDDTSFASARSEMRARIPACPSARRGFVASRLVRSGSAGTG